jgi:hypothetical protein
MAAATAAPLWASLGPDNVQIDLAQLCCSPWTMQGILLLYLAVVIPL